MSAFIVIEYRARRGSHDPARGVHEPLRQDGHYSRREDAEALARLWAEQPLSADTMIVVAEVTDWVKR